MKTYLNWNLGGDEQNLISGAELRIRIQSIKRKQKNKKLRSGQTKKESSKEHTSFNECKALSFHQLPKAHGFANMLMDSPTGHKILHHPITSHKFHF